MLLYKLECNIFEANISVFEFIQHCPELYPILGIIPDGGMEFLKLSSNLKY